MTRILKPFPRIMLAMTFWLSGSVCLAYSDYPIQGVPFSDVTLTDNFWHSRLQQNQQTTIPIALDQCYSTGRVANFLKAAAILHGDNSLGYFSTEYTFDDTDIYKILEGMSYSYKMMPSPSLKARMDTLVKIVAEAQEPDGYLTTARTAGQPGRLHAWLGARRWQKDPDLSHELYNSGHLFEAAAAHLQATGDTALLHVAKRNADLLVEKFLRGGLAYEPGHQIVEMGLVKMYHATGQEDYLKLAKYFLDIRGINGPNSKHYAYNQSHMPAKDQTEAVGHAVRATYMYSGMADVAAMMQALDYQYAINKIWANVIGKKYYVTGGVGAIRNGEAFGADYDLPNQTAYNETCAAIANIYWNWRMFLTYGESKYYDVIERSLYNGVLSGIGLGGDHFFYPNPLESTGGYSRSAWFGCACCPSNLCRFIPSVPGYVYACQGNSVYVNLFVQGHASIGLANGNMQIAQTTGYPWDGRVTLTVSHAPESEVKLMIRVPGWAKSQPVPSRLYHYLQPQKPSLKLTLNGTAVDYHEEKGYIAVSRQWHDGDALQVNFPMEVRRVVANDSVAADRGMVALERGPIVYCLEWPDNGGEVLSSVVPDDAVITACQDTTRFQAFPLHDMRILNIQGGEAVYQKDGTRGLKPKNLVAIPYYAWANRGAGQMEVWAARTVDKAEPSTTSVRHTDTLRVTVGETPSSTSGNTGYPSVPVKVDIAAVAKSFGISVSEVKSLFGTKITYAAIEPNGTVNTESTASAPGHWFTENGTVTTWENTGDIPVIFSEFSRKHFTFNIGQYPGTWHQGDNYTIRQALTYLPTGAAPRRVVFLFTVHATDVRGVYNRELAEAKRLLASADYSNVKGEEAATLRSLVTANTSNYAQMTQRLYAAVSSFVDAKVAFDKFDQAVLQAGMATADYPYAATEKLLALSKAASTVPTSVKQALTAADAIHAALKAVVLSNADAEQGGNGRNLIENADFSQNNGTTAKDWDITTFIAGFKLITNEASYDSASQPYFANYGSWGQGNSSFDFKMSQTVSNVPEGSYLVSLMYRGKDLDTAELKIATADGDTIVVLPVYGHAGQMFGNGWNSKWLVVPVRQQGHVTLTVTASAGRDETFVSLGRFRMIRLAATTNMAGRKGGQEQSADTAVYNLSGMRMQKADRKGIFIVRHHKILK
ncbi:hypothetical protein Prede_1029 [Prevotella dentalis DSM 3688]|uniref:Uncharacterized protein n=1 Tax=Prevotella dentalis (strain ATCC 49559 / DSM 3688 / JCM 13448 / NCTC 12043 / ES 2772) TaxID=908937 RepID=F9D221_PREDD|nr:beta-L-arabinofuranosidase domain-containing protein [Prevotella dentalis]AGB28366.1 hypothetical protein Prede_1029 [Prevotella dentalis DSM 3688]EGQ15839.1 hypothetical protein HMPREF9136_0899 [Prevotella dentalis DSM 3688]